MAAKNVRFAFYNAINREIFKILRKMVYNTIRLEDAEKLPLAGGDFRMASRCTRFFVLSLSHKMAQ